MKGWSDDAILEKCLQLESPCCMASFIERQLIGQFGPYPPSSGSHITTEAGVIITTESGDQLIVE